MDGQLLPDNPKGNNTMTTITRHHPLGLTVRDRTTNRATPFHTATTAIIDRARNTTTVRNATAVLAVIPTANISIHRHK